MSLCVCISLPPPPPNPASSLNPAGTLLLQGGQHSSCSRPAHLLRIKHTPRAAHEIMIAAADVTPAAKAFAQGMEGARSRGAQSTKSEAARGKLENT